MMKKKNEGREGREGFVDGGNVEKVIYIVKTSRTDTHTYTHIHTHTHTYTHTFMIFLKCITNATLEEEEGFPISLR